MTGAYISLLMCLGLSVVLSTLVFAVRDFSLRKLTEIAEERGTKKNAKSMKNNS